MQSAFGGAGTAAVRSGLTGTTSTSKSGAQSPGVVVRGIVHGSANTTGNAWHGTRGFKRPSASDAAQRCVVAVPATKRPRRRTGGVTCRVYTRSGELTGVRPTWVLNQRGASPPSVNLCTIRYAKDWPKVTAAS